MGTVCVDDDVLIEILALLPPKSVFRFKSVSPHWRDLLSSPAFMRCHAAVAARRSSGDRLVALFQTANMDLLGNKNFVKEVLIPMKCVMLPICNEEINMNVPAHVGHFVSSSNGLILCSRVCGDLFTYHVGNPLTGKFVELPLPWHGVNSFHVPAYGEVDKYNHRVTPRLERPVGPLQQPACHLRQPAYSVGLICKRESTVYTVIRAGRCRGIQTAGGFKSFFPIDSYSSETGKWTHGLTDLETNGNGVAIFYMEPPVVANGVVHWYSQSRILAVYDPEGGDQRVQVIKLPRSCIEDRYECCNYAVTRSADDDVLWLAALQKRTLMFYMLPKEGGGYKRPVNVKISRKEWVLMDEVSVSSISRISKLMNCKGPGLIACEEYTLESLMQGSGSEVVAVLQQRGNVFLYNVQRRSMVKLDYSGRYHKDFRLYPYLQPSLLYPYCL